MASSSAAPIPTESQVKDQLKPFLSNAQANFKAKPLDTATVDIKTAWVARVSGILHQLHELLKTQNGFAKVKARVETWKTTLHDFKLSNGLAEEDVEDLFWSDEDDDMGDIPSEPAVPARVEDSLPANLGAGVQASSIPGPSTLPQTITGTDGGHVVPPTLEVHDAGPTAPHETISDSAGDHVHVKQSSSRDVHDAGAAAVRQTISGSVRAHTDTTLRPSHDAQVTFEEGQNPPSPRAESDKAASEDDDESGASSPEPSEPARASRKRPHEDDSEDSADDLPTPSSRKGMPELEVVIPRSGKSRAPPQPSITIEGPKVKRAKADDPGTPTPDDKNAHKGTIEKHPNGSATWRYHDKEKKKMEKKYFPVGGENCERCTTNDLECMVLSPGGGNTGVACLHCTRDKSKCSFVRDRRDARTAGAGTSTGIEPAGKQTDTKRIKVEKQAIKVEKQGGPKKKMTQASSSRAKQQEKRSPSVVSGNNSVIEVPAARTLGFGPEVDECRRKQIAAKEALEEANNALKEAIRERDKKEKVFVKATEATQNAMTDFKKHQSRGKQSN